MNLARKSAAALRKIKSVTKPDESAHFLVNRNPRNLEKLRIAYKPAGYHLEKPRNFWNKLQISSSAKYVTAQLIHFENGPVVEASTSEWCIKKQLYNTKDTAAYVNLARVFSQRCLEAGLIEMWCDIQPVENGKLEKFLNEMKANGISLTEPTRVLPHRPWDQYRPEKPWEVTE